VRIYDQEDPFQLAPYYLGAYRARLNANLAVLNGIEGKIDGPLQPDGTRPLIELYLGDYQVVDVAKPSSEDNYLEIELALLQGHAHTTCGGRSLNDHAVDTSLTFVVTAGKARASATASTTRPYERPTASPTWRRRIPSRPSPAGSCCPPSSLTNLRFSKKPLPPRPRQLDRQRVGAWTASCVYARQLSTRPPEPRASALECCCDGRAQASPLASAPRLPLGAGPHARRLSRRRASGSERQQRRNGGGEKGQGTHHRHDLSGR